MDYWKTYLFNNFDQQLPDLLKFAFPLDFDRNLALGITEDNHISAEYCPDNMDKYIQVELSFGAMLGPFYDKPIALYIFPLMAEKKFGSETRKTIVDLICPNGDSVNGCIS